MIKCEKCEIYLKMFFFNFLFLNLDNYLTMHYPELKLSKCVENIVAEGTVSQNFYEGLGSFSVKFRKNIQRK